MADQKIFLEVREIVRSLIKQYPNSGFIVIKTDEAPNGGTDVKYNANIPIDDVVEVLKVTHEMIKSRLQ